MKFLNVGSGLTAAGLAVVLTLGMAGCGTPNPPDGLDEASAMGERPVAMQGASEFFNGEIVATVTVSRGIGRGQRGGPGPGGGGRGERGGPGGGGRGGPPDLAGMEPEQAVAYQNARMALGSPLPPVTTRLKLENRSKETLEIEILEVNSDLGNFAVRPAKISVSPGQTAEPDPMISQLGVTSDEIAVKVRLRKVAGAVPAGGVPASAETQVLEVVSLSKAGTTGAKAGK